VVESGLFVGLCSAVIVGEPDGDAYLIGDPLAPPRRDLSRRRA
jgi:hypothetical protein